MSQAHGWIQWKGTDVCMDIHCECGAATHVDGEFCYHVKCGKCGRVYQCGERVELKEIQVEPEGCVVSSLKREREK